MSVQKFSFLACLEVAEKFVVGGWWWVVCKPILVFSLNLSQAEQKLTKQLVYMYLAPAPYKVWICGPAK